MSSNSITLKSASGISLYQECTKQHGENNDLVLLCMTDGLALKHDEQVAQTTSWLLVLAGSLVFFMQLGFAMLCAGSVRRKNISNTLLKNLLDACGAAVAFYVIGYAFAYGGSDPAKGYTFIGNANFCLTGDVDYGFWFFQYTFSAAAVTIIAGTLAERCRMSAYLSYSVFMTGFVYPVVVHAIWSENGFLSAFAARPFAGVGVVDFAGSGVVHMTGGTTALVATWILGARTGRFDSLGDLDSRSAANRIRHIPGHSIALQVMGGFMLWFGWYGFNAGSALLLGTPNTGHVGALAATNTSLAAAAGAIASLCANMWFVSRQTGEMAFDLTKAVNGSLAGLVAITAPCGTVEPWAALLIGTIAGVIYLFASLLLIRWRLDDAVDGIPVHLFGGTWGMFAVGLFSSPSRLMDAYGQDKHVGLFYSAEAEGTPGVLLGTQCLAIIFVVAWNVILMIPFFVLLNHIGWLRVDTMEEIAGLDARYNHATQEDHDQLKEQIVKEFKKYQHATNQSLHGGGSTAGGGNSYTLGVEAARDTSDETPL